MKFILINRISSTNELFIRFCFQNVSSTFVYLINLLYLKYTNNNHAN